MKGAEQRGGIGMCEEKCEGKEKGKGKESREVRGAWRGMSVEGEERREKEEERRGTSLKVSGVVRSRPRPRKQLKRS